MTSNEDECGFIREEMQNTKRSAEDQSLAIPVKQEDCCVFCGRLPLDLEIKRTFDINTCQYCVKTELKFITKTKCMADYLLTNDEIKHFRCLSRVNPHKGTWNDMLLYLEKQIKEFAVSKFGSMEEIEKTKTERKALSKKRKLDKIKKRVKDLKKKTFQVVERKNHKHRFVHDGKYSVCECGMKIEEEEL